MTSCRIWREFTKPNGHFFLDMYIKSDSFCYLFPREIQAEYKNVYFISVIKMDIFCLKMWASEVCKFDIYYVHAYE